MTAPFPLRSRYDALVVGARVAGAATAMLLARRGLRVLAIDRGRRGSDTLSTHALMRGGVLQLAAWGLLERVRAAATPPVRRTVFHYGDVVVPVAIEPRDGVDALYAPRRTVLDAILADAAEEAGSEVVHGVRATALLRARDGRVSGAVIEGSGRTQAIEADIVIGADGLRSTMAALMGAATLRLGRHATAVVYGYWSGVELDGYHWYYRPGVSAGAIPTNGATCVFAAVPAARFHDEIRDDVGAGYHRVIAEVDPGLALALHRARRLEPLRGFPGVRGLVRQGWGAGWALVGDAGYFRDPITAHGITDALRDAELLSRAVARGTGAALAEYQALRDDLAGGLFEASDDIASFTWDLETVSERHRFMSTEMRREVQALAALHREDARGAAGQAPGVTAPPRARHDADRPAETCVREGSAPVPTT
jgi:flavin-dependent dehydrogenase